MKPGKTISFISKFLSGQQESEFIVTEVSLGKGDEAKFLIMATEALSSYHR